MADALIENLAVADTETIIHLKVDRQATTVESSGATLHRFQYEEGSIHIVMQRLLDHRIVIDYLMRPGETVCYALSKRGDSISADLQWQSFSIPEPVPAFITPPPKVIQWIMQWGSFLIRTGLLWNLLAVLPTLYYFFLPKGTIVEDNMVYERWILPISGCALFIALPCYVRAILIRRAKRQSYVYEMMALVFCLTPLFLSMSLLYFAGAVRGLQAPYYGDGGDYVRWTDGYY